jgi:hypothetical protein
MAVIDHVMEHHAAITVAASTSSAGVTQAGDDDRHFLFRRFPYQQTFVGGMANDDRKRCRQATDSAASWVALDSFDLDDPVFNADWGAFRAGRSQQYLPGHWALTKFGSDTMNIGERARRFWKQEVVTW